MYSSLALSVGLPLRELGHEIEKITASIQQHQHTLAMVVNGMLNRTIKLFTGQIDYTEYISACAEHDPRPRMYEDFSMKLYKKHTCTVVARRSCLRMVRHIQRRLRGWVRESPTLCCGKLLHLDAEMAVLKKDFKTARVKFTLAIAQSKSEKILFDLINQGYRAGIAMYEFRDMELSKKFFCDAHEACIAWDAIGWADYLRDQVNPMFPGEIVL